MADGSSSRTSARLTRRAFTKRAALAVGAVALPLAPSTPGPRTSPAPRDWEPLDDALAQMEGRGAEYGFGLANHGPMAAEALCALGRGDRAGAWVSSYRKRLDDPVPSRERITEATWRAAVGDARRVTDWTRFFEAQLAERPWPAVLDSWAARLAPGLVAAAFHGVIRTGHAVRALSVRETPRRRRELAAGLAYWAARHQALPRSEAAVDLQPVGEALARVPRLPAGDRRRGLIADGLRALDSFPGFGPAAALADLRGDPGRVLSELCAATAAAYLANTPTGLIALLHGVTGPSAVRLLLPHLSRETTDVVLRNTWHAAAALYAAFAVNVPGPPGQAAPADGTALADAALAAGDEHAIKMTEACLREDAIASRAVYARAARDACERLKS
jgi:hypothetical protein